MDDRDRDIENVGYRAGRPAGRPGIFMAFTEMKRLPNRLF